MKKLTEKEKREVGYKVNDAFVQLESSMSQIKMPDFAAMEQLVETIGEKRKLVEDKLLAMKAEMSKSGIGIKPRPKPRRRAKKK